MTSCLRSGVNWECLFHSFAILSLSLSPHPPSPPLALLSPWMNRIHSSCVDFECYVTLHNCNVIRSWNVCFLHKLKLNRSESQNSWLSHRPVLVDNFLLSSPIWPFHVVLSLLTGPCCRSLFVQSLFTKPCWIVLVVKSLLFSPCWPIRVFLFWMTSPCSPIRFDQS